MSGSDLRPVTTIVASAGTGKTYTLVERIRDAVLRDGVAPARLVATTFTNRAAGELTGRIRQGLLKAGATDRATEMLTARIGTVNAVAGELVAEFALELGRSPDAEVIDDDRARIAFDRATGPVMLEHARALSALAERLGMPDQRDPNAFSRIEGWQDVVRDIVKAARSNGMKAAALGASAERSIESFQELLPGPVATAEELDEALARSVRDVLTELTPDVRAALKKGTRDKDLPAVEAAASRLNRGEALPWGDWVKLTKLGATQADEHFFERVRQAAGEHPRHPRLASDVAAFVRGVFACAAACMSAYAEYKDARGQLDFVDQEALALRILRDPAHADRLAELVDAVYVDEFQDSSPMQVALFTALARVAGRNAWVGDPKQSIYAFRGAAPELTTEAAHHVATASGGGTEYLRTSYRARPPLADFVDASFGPSFRRAGFATDEIEFDGAARSERPGAPPAFARWDTGAKGTKAVRAARVAAAVDRLLSDPDGWAIESDDARSPRGGDVAILCRYLTDVRAVAKALGDRGIPVAVERAGLMATPEVRLVVAALRWIADRRDGVAAAELARLTARDEHAWLNAAFEEDPAAALRDVTPAAKALDALRERAGALTPLEVLDAVTNVEPLLGRIRGWGRAEERLVNLEALRDAAADHQDMQRAAHRAVTLSGLCADLTRTDPDRPRATDPDAVQVLTYHGAKGLEWPIVVLTDLDADARGGAFGLSAQSDGTPDWSDPLAGRWLSYWPWPYGSQKKGAVLDETAAASPEGMAATERERLERVRLLYVGVTRAKDHLVLVTKGDAPQTWLDELTDEDGTPTVRFEAGRLIAGSRAFPLKPATDLDALPEASRAPRTEYAPAPVARVQHPPKRITPSASPAHAVPPLLETVILGDRVPLSGRPDMRAVGEACHGFFAWDVVDRSFERRLARAGAILDAWSVTALQPDDLVAMSDRLRAFLGERFAGASVRHEWPVHVPFGHRTLSGRIDLLLDLGDGFALIDHKSFPAELGSNEGRLRAFAGQTAAYARAILAATGRPCREVWAHQPVVGRIVRVGVEGSEPVNAM